MTAAPQLFLVKEGHQHLIPLLLLVAGAGEMAAPRQDRPTVMQDQVDLAEEEGETRPPAQLAQRPQEKVLQAALAIQ